jgi:hypothetical protein
MQLSPSNKRNINSSVASFSPISLLLNLGAFSIASVVSTAPVIATDESDGYYYSLSHPDLGKKIEKDARYRQGEGYYGALPTANTPTPTTPATTATPVTATTTDGEKQTSSTTGATAVAIPSDLPILSKFSKPRILSFDDLMKEGKNEYAQNAFHAAKDTFEEAVQDQPKNQDAHFWLAMSNWNLHDYESTQDELRIVFALGPFSSQGMVARSRLMDMAAYFESQKHPVANSPFVVRQAIRQISHQASWLQIQKTIDGENTAQFRTDLAGYEADKIIADTNRYLRSEYRIGRAYGYRPSNLGEVSNLGYIRAHYVRADGRVQALGAMRDARQRSLNVQDWQNYLLRGLGDAPHQGDPHLNALGTNLYVQNYGDRNVPRTEPSDPPLRATALPLPKQANK